MKMFSEEKKMFLDEKEKMVQKLLEILRTRRRSLRDSGGTTSTPPDVSEKILESAKEDEKEKLQELMEKLGKRRNLRDSGGPSPTSSPHDDNVVSDMLEKILKSVKEEEDKPDPYTVDWTLLEALLIKFREEEEAAFSVRLPCKISHGEDDPRISHSPSYVPWYSRLEGPTSRHQQKWNRNPVSSKKYRKGACENCGAMTHDLNSCMEGSLKHGPKSTYIPSVLPDTKMAKRSTKRGPKSTCKPFVLPDTKIMSIRVSKDLIWKLLHNDPKTQSASGDPLHADPNVKVLWVDNPDSGS